MLLRAFTLAVALISVATARRDDVSETPGISELQVADLIDSDISHPSHVPDFMLPTEENYKIAREAGPVKTVLAGIGMPDDVLMSLPAEEDVDDLQVATKQKQKIIPKKWVRALCFAPLGKSRSKKMQRWLDRNSRTIKNVLGGFSDHGKGCGSKRDLDHMLGELSNVVVSAKKSVRHVNRLNRKCKHFNRNFGLWTGYNFLHAKSGKSKIAKALATLMKAMITHLDKGKKLDASLFDLNLVKNLLSALNVKIPAFKKFVEAESMLQEQQQYDDIDVLLEDGEQQVQKHRGFFRRIGRAFKRVGRAIKRVAKKVVKHVKKAAKKVVKHVKKVAKKVAKAVVNWAIKTGAKICMYGLSGKIGKRAANSLRDFIIKHSRDFIDIGLGMSMDKKCRKRRRLLGRDGFDNTLSMITRILKASEKSIPMMKEGAKNCRKYDRKSCKACNWRRRIIGTLGTVGGYLAGSGEDRSVGISKLIGVGVKAMTVGKRFRPDSGDLREVLAGLEKIAPKLAKKVAGITGQVKKHAKKARDVVKTVREKSSAFKGAFGKTKGKLRGRGRGFGSKIGKIGNAIKKRAKGRGRKTKRGFSGKIGKIGKKIRGRGRRTKRGFFGIRGRGRGFGSKIGKIGNAIKKRAKGRGRKTKRGFSGKIGKIGKKIRGRGRRTKRGFSGKIGKMSKKIRGRGRKRKKGKKKKRRKRKKSTKKRRKRKKGTKKRRKRKKGKKKRRKRKKGKKSTKKRAQSSLKKMIKAVESKKGPASMFMKPGSFKKPRGKKKWGGFYSKLDRSVEKAEEKLYIKKQAKKLKRKINRIKSKAPRSETVSFTCKYDAKAMGTHFTVHTAGGDEVCSLKNGKTATCAVKNGITRGAHGFTLRQGGKVILRCSRPAGGEQRVFDVEESGRGFMLLGF